MPRKNTSGRVRRIKRNARAELQIRKHIHLHIGRAVWAEGCPLCQLSPKPIWARAAR